MLKCLYCEAEYDSGRISFIYFDEKPASSGFICSNGHLVGVSKAMNEESFELFERNWSRGFPGNLTHLSLFDFDTKNGMNLKLVLKINTREKTYLIDTQISKIY